MLIGARTSGGLIKIVVGTNGEGYTSRPDVTISGGGGTGASAVAAMAGTRVESIIVTNSGTGYTGSPAVSFSGGGGTGAAATAYAHTASLRPMCFFKGRFGEVYGVDGMGRGIRWTGGTATAAPIGLNKPVVPPAVVAVTGATTTDLGRYVSSIQLADGGAGYASAPTVTLTGGTPAKTAEARAAVFNGRVVAVRVTEKGAGYRQTPQVVFGSGVGSGGTFTVGVAGEVSQVLVAAGGTGYTSEGTNAPVVQVATSNGLTGFNASVSVGANGVISGVAVLSGGTGATTTPGLTISAGTGSGALLTPLLTYAVQALTVANSGQGYFTPPIITIFPDPADRTGGNASAECAVSPAGNITAATVVSQGAYELPPTAFIANSQAVAQAALADVMRGKYRCAIRYVDGTAAENGGPLASSISASVEVDTGEGQQALTWTLSHPYLDNRVAAVELWRTAGDQVALLFRVATIVRDGAGWSSPYSDTLDDFSLTDPTRPGYAVLPITLPSGQINARRFVVPPGEFSVATMFQDRAWYAVDSTGRRANSLYYSEVDEPESVPESNELIVQENTGVPDKVVALVPMASALLVVQSQHLYRLMYVAQPVIDASIMLMAHRGVLNQRCAAVMAGVAFMADSVGMYAFDGNTEQSVSVPVDNYWRDRIIDFSQSDKFHVSADHLTRTVRFFYCRSGETEPARALCYCTATQAWWEESYPVAITASAAVALGQQMRLAVGGADGAWRKDGGSQDGSTPVPYQYLSGNMPLTGEPDRAIEMLYDPTVGDSTVTLGLHYNNSPTARPAAVSADRGGGFTVSAGGGAALNLKKTRSALGEATGRAVAHYAGRKDERSAGGDQDLAVAISGSQSADRVVFHSVRVRGVQ
jgi:hypothetical protein